MVMVHRTCDEVIARRKADTVFVQFHGTGWWGLNNAEESKDLLEMLAWLRRKNIKVEHVMRRGQLEGFSGLYAIHLDPHSDPRWKVLLARYETPDGVSRKPGSYEFWLIEYAQWLTDDGRHAGEE